MSGNLPVIPFAYSLETTLKECPELKMSDIQILREWCEKQAHFPKVSNRILAIFLHSNYFLLEPTKTTLENFFTIKTHVPEFFNNRDPLGDSGLRATMNVVKVCMLPELTNKGERLCFARLTDTEPSHYVFTDAVKLFLMIGDMCIYKERLAEGYHFLGDATGISLGHVGRLTPLNIKRFLFFIQEAAPVRLKGVHILNAPAAAELILNMAKPFMKKELLKLIHFHPSMKALAEYVPIEYLPKEYGGKADSSDVLYERTKKELEDHRDFFLEEQAWARVNESLRVGKTSTVDNLFGVEGSFKKLDID